MHNDRMIILNKSNKKHRPRYSDNNAGDLQFESQIKSNDWRESINQSRDLKSYKNNNICLSVRHWIAHNDMHH